MKPSEVADKIVQILKDKNFIIQRYDSYSSYSVYLKLDYGVCNSIRISDHKGKSHLCYRYNVIIDGENNIIEDKYMRYYFNQDNISGLINQILFDKTIKVRRYGEKAYKRFMVKNMEDHKNDNGFWKDSKLVTNGIQIKKFISDIGEDIINLMRMPDGSYIHH